MLQDDGQLVARVLAGEKTAFGLLIDRYRPAALRLASRMLTDAVDAEDVAQEALLQAFLGLASLRNPDSFGPWLLAIVVNLSKMRMRARRDWDPADEWHGGRVLEDFTPAEELERELADAGGFSSRMVKEVRMIEVTVHDVMLRVPKADPEAEWLPGPREKVQTGICPSYVTEGTGR